MKSPTDAAALTLHAPPAAASPRASPWGRRPAGVWALVVEGWRESVEIYARAGRYRLPWGPFV
jgi:hypothetical protein